MRRQSALRATVALAAALVALASPASAEWRRAESDRFIVYSDGAEQMLRTFVQKLETYDRILRYSSGLPMEQPPLRKLPIYTVGSHRGLAIVRPGIGDAIAGYYIAHENDIFAVAMRTGREDDVLLHEYAHHFMSQNFAHPYPGWFVEGFAEYYMTADIDDDRVQIGRYNENRGYWLMNGQWMSLQDLLTKRPGEVTARAETYYPLAWLLTHWFLSDPERKAQLSAYLLDLAGGGDPIEAMERATGMTMPDLTRALRTYSRRSLMTRVLTADFPQANVAITTLPRSADDLLLLNQRLRLGIAEEDRAQVIARVRTLAARHPDDPFARLVLARAETTIGDRAEGERLLTALIEAEPENVEALQAMAASVMARADALEDSGQIEALQRTARAHLGRAFAADDADYRTFLMLAESRSGAPNYPNDNDVQTLRLANTLAPQLAGARLNLAAVLIYREQSEEAISLLRAVANDPHDAGLAAAAQAMIEQAGVAAGSADALAAAEAMAESAVPAPETPEPELEAP